MQLSLLLSALVMTYAQELCSTNEIQAAVTSEVLTVSGSVLQCALDVGLDPTGVPYPALATAAQAALMAEDVSCIKVYGAVQTGIANISPACILTKAPKVITSDQISGISYPVFLALARAGAGPAATAAPAATETTAPTATETTAPNATETLAPTTTVNETATPTPTPTTTTAPVGTSQNNDDGSPTAAKPSGTSNAVVASATWSALAVLAAATMA
ncbi:hypothetical protein SPRG_05555 [Saprolegnia parasitica CBS 223.65]|uniref:Elicitin n=1 Tax=Saprolegnia parasitica (strain CBS 223.65) TaxID=695850 RepID=A0A067CS31_SAPPC|nr:hypothetical protein SPRG_05555 [Saprolegnia parasitica CBS 223.65]KDO29602.1 hypothetical protein SPRG_05555 [Saprolegnia parasitica CBS 223.65]|eukprot:XP_012199662.1 hypothetical protein SPRG_05555 [Saprolegnia parasitica CBS 223.65]